MFGFCEIVSIRKLCYSTHSMILKDWKYLICVSIWYVYFIVMLFQICILYIVCKMLQHKCDDKRMGFDDEKKL